MIDFIQKTINNLEPWFLDHGIRIVIIFIAVFVLNKFIRIFLDKLIRKAIISDKFLSKEAEEKRENTLITIFSNAFKIIIWLTAAMIILSELGIEIAPVLAGAGIIGLALGFGAQYFIRDVISGLFIILENQYRVGDVVCFEKTCGEVENITLRMTVLRSLDGTAHYVPNGEIKKTSNLSKEFARVNLDIGISYNSDIEKVIRVINQVGKDLSNDSQWKKDIIKAPEFLRIDKFGDSAIEIKILGETKPLKQWEITGELRKRIKIAFDKEGIEIPYPQIVVHKNS